MSKVILDDNTTARIYANSSGNLLPFSDYDGFRMYIPARSTVYENVKGLLINYRVNIMLANIPKHSLIKKRNEPTM